MLLLAIVLAAAMHAPGPHAACLTQPMYATSGSANVFSGVTNNNYVPFNAPQTITTGVSCGPGNAWYLTIQEAFSVGSGTGANTLYPCMQSTTPGYTFVDSLSFNNTNICNPIPANVPTTGIVGGGPTIGGASGTNTSQLASEVAQAHVTVPNNFTFTVQCLISSSTAGSQAGFGFCAVRADPI